MRPPVAVLCVLAAVSAACLPGQAQAAEGRLDPFQMVRSLQLVQDQIADGDQAALPMQRKMLELIDARLADAAPEEFAEERNFRALMTYAMSGGNPATVQKVVSRLILDEDEARLSAGLLEYIQGQPGRALAALRDIDPRAMAAEIGPALALIKGTLYLGTDTQLSLSFFDYARLSGPGSLIEEAALRRSILLTAEAGDSTRFASLSEQYVRRFLRSPYASQFADSFVSGIARLHPTIDLDRVTEIIDEMNDEQGRVVYLRIARQAAIDHLHELLAFARQGIERTAARDGNSPEARAILYSALASVASENVMSVRGELEAIDPSHLSEPDRALLVAARRIVDEVVSSPVGAAPPIQHSGPDEAGNPSPPAEPGREAKADPVEAVTDFVAGKREQLRKIDQLLQENDQ